MPIITPNGHALGWLPSVPDLRDMPAAVPRVKLPDSVDLRDKFPPVYDQMSIGSCTAHALIGLIEYEAKCAGYNWPDPLSRLFLYYEERRMEHSIQSDAGAFIRDGCKVLTKTGAPPETDWPYVVERFATKPTSAAYADAVAFRAASYARVYPTLIPLKTQLALGKPFTAGIAVYASFESDEVAQHGIVPLPSPTESLLGGHAIAIVGYDSSHFIFRNSWSEGWGNRGYGYLPFSYVTNHDLASDFWTLSLE